MSKTYYVCKYTPIELLQAFGGECENLNQMPEGFDLADQIAHPNICGFGKAVLEAVMSGKVKELVLVNLKPAKLAGVLSEGMLLCAEDENGELSLMVPEKKMPAGAEIC